MPGTRSAAPASSAAAISCPLTQLPARLARPCPPHFATSLGRHRERRAERRSGRSLGPRGTGHRGPGAGARRPRLRRALADYASFCLWQLLRAPVTAGKTVDGITLDTAQIGNAQVIYDVAAGMQLPEQASVIGIATAMQESTLQNIAYGTSDSLGLFQQRPSQGWGSPAEIMQPTYAATAFYTHLEAVPGWQSLPLTVAAQDVQHSAYPGAYAQWQPLATALAATFNGTAANCVTDASFSVPASGVTRLPKGFTLPAGTPAAVATAIRYAADQLGKPYIWGGTGPSGFDCSGLVMMAYRGRDHTSPHHIPAGHRRHARLRTQPAAARGSRIRGRLRRHALLQGPASARTLLWLLFTQLSD